MCWLRVTEGQASAAEHHCKYIEVSAVLNYKIDELLVGIVTQVRLKRRAMSRMAICTAPVSGCYRQARVLVDVLFSKSYQRRYRSCDNLFCL